MPRIRHPYSAYDDWLSYRARSLRTWRGLMWPCLKSAFHCIRRPWEPFAESFFGLGNTPNEYRRERNAHNGKQSGPIHQRHSSLLGQRVYIWPVVRSGARFLQPDTMLMALHGMSQSTRSRNLSWCSHISFIF